MLSRILAICLGLMTACYAPPQPDCGFTCGPSGECPSNYFCATDGVCHRNDTSMTTMCRADARPDTPRPIDAVPADADTTPPQVFETMPMDGATNVPRNSVVRVQFTEPVTNVTNSTFLLANVSGGIAGTVNAESALTYTFTPAGLLAANDTIDVSLTSGIRDGIGNPLMPTSFAFMTGP